MKLHPRTENFNSARLELETYLIGWGNKFNLTIIEIISILEYLISNQLKYLLRLERHPNEPGKKADEE